MADFGSGLLGCGEEEKKRTEIEKQRWGFCS